MNFVDLTRDELLDVQAKALDAYEGGNPIMSDAEYDELVGFLNMENTANIVFGVIGRSPSTSA